MKISQTTKTIHAVKNTHTRTPENYYYPNPSRCDLIRFFFLLFFFAKTLTVLDGRRLISIYL